MNKKLIAIAVAAGLAPVAVQAEPTVYGHGQVELATYGGDTYKGAAMVDNARGRIGIKGSEDLGGGLTSLFKAEFKTDFADGDSDVATDNSGANKGIALTKREVMVGLKGGFGQIEAGRLKSPYKYTGGVKYDPYVTTVHEARGYVMSGKVGQGNGYGHNGFISDSISYQKKFGPIKLWVLHDFDNGGPSADNKGTGTVAAIAYQQGNIHAFVKTLTDDEAGDKEYKSNSIGAKVGFGNMDVAVQLESAEKGTLEEDYMFVNFNMKMGSNIITANYGTYEDNAATANEKTKITLAVKHKFSKKTSAWVGYTTVEEGAATKVDNNVTSIGLRVDI